MVCREMSYDYESSRPRTGTSYGRPRWGTEEDGEVPLPRTNSKTYFPGRSVRPMRDTEIEPFAPANRSHSDFHKPQRSPYQGGPPRRESSAGDQREQYFGYNDRTSRDEDEYRPQINRHYNDSRSYTNGHYRGSRFNQREPHHDTPSTDDEKGDLSERERLKKRNLNKEEPTERRFSKEIGYEKVSKSSFKERESRRKSKGSSSDTKEKSPLPEILVEPIRCPHCHYTTNKSSEYISHLDGDKHKEVMIGVGKQLDKVLSMMLTKMKEEQRKMDEKSAGRTWTKNYCPTCLLSYYSKCTRHNDSFLHKKIMEFLKPHCKICNKYFKPNSYEEHICHLEHILCKMSTMENKKSKKEKREKKENSKKHKKMKTDGALTGGDTENSKVVVEVAIKEKELGVLDEKNVSNLEESLKPEQNCGVAEPGNQLGVDEDSISSTKEKENVKCEVLEREKKVKKSIKKKPEMNIGAEYCELVDSYFCELCKMYITHETLLEKARDKHCVSRLHLQKMMRITKLEHRRLYSAKIKAKQEAEKLANKSA